MEEYLTPRANALDSSLLLTSSNISDPTNQQLTANTGSVVKLKIMSLNCCSLRSQTKRARLAGLTIEHQPDIILGCESHLDDSFASPEVFPDNFDIIRKDRSIGGGGVFLVVSNKLSMCEEPLLDADAELVWARLQFSRGPELYLCSYYRSPNSGTQPITQLNESLSRLYNRNVSPNLILAGDFNLPDVEWQDGHGYPLTMSEINTLFLDVNDYGLEQCVQEPTREDHTLDLVFASQPSLIESITTTPGISDHEAVIFSINAHSVPSNKKKPRKTFVYHKANLQNLKNDLKSFQDTFLLSDPYLQSIEDNWTSLRKLLLIPCSRIFLKER